MMSSATLYKETRLFFHLCEQPQNGGFEPKKSDFETTPRRPSVVKIKELRPR